VDGNTLSKNQSNMHVACEAVRVSSDAAEDVSTPPNVAFFASAFAPHIGGVEELVAKLGEQLQLRGSSPLVVTACWPRSLPRSEVLKGIEVVRRPFRVPDAIQPKGTRLRWSSRNLILQKLKQNANFIVSFPIDIAILISRLKKANVDLVHIQCVSANGFYGWVLARILRLPVVVTLQGELTMDAGRIYQTTSFVPWVLRKLLRTADAVTACSSATLAEGEEFAGLSLGARGSVIYNGVSLTEFDSAVPEVRKFPYVFGIGRLVENKGFDVLLRAFALSERMDHELVIAGVGPELETLVALAEELGLAGRVDFVGRADRTRTAALFRGCAVFVLPSLHEPMGIVNLEAMAAGKPVIASRVGGVPEIVLDGQTGLLVPAGDPQAMADALKKVISVETGQLQSEASLMGEAGRKRAEEFDWPAICTRYTDLYKAVLAGQIPAPRN
jgi:glycogen synthase